MRIADLTAGRTTVFLQIPLTVLQTTPAVGRVLVARAAQCRLPEPTAGSRGECCSCSMRWPGLATCS